ncbi:MAG: hypothetical protein Kow0025_16930 [Thermodesulfovibrionales bacterium]
MPQDRFERLYSLAEAVNQARSTQDVFDRTMDWLEGAYGMESGALWVLGQDAVLKLVASRGAPFEEPGKSVRAAPLGACGCGGALPAHDAPRPDSVGDRVLQCLISMPLFSASRLMGTLSMASLYRSKVDEELVSVFDALGGLVGSALERVAEFEAVSLENLQWETAINHMDELVSIHDPDMRVRKINPAVERFLGRSGREILGRRCYELFHKDGKQHKCCPFGAAASTLRPHHADVEEPDGTILHVSVYPIVRGSRLEGAVHIARDVTAARTLGENARQMNKQGALSRLAAGLAHDINNPLYYASNYLFLLRETVSDNRARELLGKVEEGIQRARKVLDGLVASARPGSSQLTDVDVSDVARRVVDLLSAEASGRGVTLAVELEPGTMARAEGKRLFDALVNVIKNAMEAEASHVSVSCDEDEDHVRLVVADNGPGMGEEDQARIFEPYFTTKREGTGLGLYMTYHNIRALGGAVWCRSSKGNGTKFYILLKKG